jgi:hypothetical protein
MGSCARNEGADRHLGQRLRGTRRASLINADADESVAAKVDPGAACERNLIAGHEASRKARDAVAPLWRATIRSARAL